VKNFKADASASTRLDNRRRRRAAIDRYTAAERALCENAITEYAAGIDDETPEFGRVNREVHAAKRDVPAWRRALIDRRIIRDLDYWTRTGQ
jgi:hypothetical protein